MEMPRPRRVCAALLVMSALVVSSGCIGEMSLFDEDGAPDGVTPGRDQGGLPGTDQGMTQERDLATARDMMQGDGGGQSLDMGEPDAMMTPPDFEPLDPNTLSQPQLFTCADPQAPRSSPARLRRMVDTEWTRAFGGSVTSELSLNPLTPSSASLYSTYDRDLTIDSPTLDQYLSVSGMHTHQYEMQHYGCFARKDSFPDATCIESFINELLERRVLFRPPTPEELAQAIALANANLDKERNGVQERNQTIEQILRATWLTSGALFRAELGEDQEDAQGRRHLTDWELAHALSYALTDRAPGAPEYVSARGLVPEGVLPDMRQAAIDGTISDRQVIAAFVRKYLGGADPGTMDPTAPSDVLPPEILALEGREKNLAIIEWAGRHDLLLDFGVNEVYDQFKRSRRSQYWMSEKLKSFFHQWLGYGDTASVFKDTPWATSRFATEDPDRQKKLTAYEFLTGVQRYHDPTLDEQLDETIARVLAQDTDVVHNLLTTRDFFLNASTHGEGDYFRAQLGYIYDIDSRVDPVPDTRSGRWRTLPSTQRAGVLTHPAWLASHGGNFDNDPSAVHRGKWVREMLLCGTVPNVPIGVAAQLQSETIDKPARQRIKAVTEAPECAGCHGLMNPLGYPFEIYNHAGYVRADDHGFSPDGSSTLLHMPQGDDALSEAMAVRDAIEMMEAFGASTHVKRCVIRQSFRYFMGRDETMADACTLADMEQSYDMNGGSFTEMLVTLFTSDTFLYRTHTPQEAQP